MSYVVVFIHYQLGIFQIPPFPKMSFHTELSFRLDFSGRKKKIKDVPLFIVVNLGLRNRHELELC